MTVQLPIGSNPPAQPVKTRPTVRPVPVDLFDWVIAGVLSMVLLVPMIYIGLRIYRETGQLPFFRQKRNGGAAGEIMVWKFLTMIDGFDEDGKPTKIVYSPFAEWLRKTRLDETPQIVFNVFVFGNMNLFGGFRPMIEADDRVYRPHRRAQAAKERMLSSVSGLEQTRPNRDEQRGRSSGCVVLTEKKLSGPMLERYWFKLQIIYATVLVVLRTDESQV